MSYRFRTAAQWNACSFDGAEREGRGAAAGLRPYAPYSRAYELFETDGAHAPVITRAGEILWRDDDHVLHRLPACADAPETSAAPFALGHASRIVATSRGLWVAEPHAVHLYEEDTLARLLVVPLRDVRVVDITGDGRDGVFVLVERGKAWECLHLDCGGRIDDSVPLDDLCDARAFVFLPRAGRFVVWTGQHPPRLVWFPRRGGAPAFSVPVPALRPCFAATALGGDGRDRVLLAGADDDLRGGAYVLVLDAAGHRVEEIALDQRDALATGVAAARDRLIVTGPRGLLRYTKSDVVPDGIGDVRGVVVTPMLQAPDREDGRRWLRVEATSALPPGSTLEISFAAPHDAGTRERMAAITADPSLNPGERARRLRAEDGWSAPIVFHGGDAQTEASSMIFAAPLFDVRERYLWVSISLSAGPGGRLPQLSELAVLYPGRSLMENLPAIYQRTETQPGNFLRALVGVLETTTHEIDDRVASLGGLAHPSTATGPWLDFIARWLGLPWDDGLGVEQKRSIVSRASELARGRGTRAGLEALLDSLVPGTPRRFRVTDATADFGFATVGGRGCDGSALPAILAAGRGWSAELDLRTVLGRMRLPPGCERDDGAWRLAGRITIEIAASGEERKAWEPWLLRLIAEMVPLTARVDLRWVHERVLRGDRLDGTLTIEAPPAPRLGTDALTGLARLPERGSHLSESGLDPGTRLR